MLMTRSPFHHRRNGLLDHSLVWGGRGDLNPRPLEPQSSALPTELRPPSLSCSSPAGYGAPGRTRTCNPRLRRPMLYPVELQAPSLSLALTRSSSVFIVAKKTLNPVHPTGRGGGIRTPDPLLPKQLRYQAALHPEIIISHDELRTRKCYVGCAPASIKAGLKHVKRFDRNRPCKKAATGTAFVIGAPGRIRTSDLLVRSQTLYPTELRAL